jgi:hypothetical protein
MNRRNQPGRRPAMSLVVMVALFSLGACGTSAATPVRTPTALGSTIESPAAASPSTAASQATPPVGAAPDCLTVLSADEISALVGSPVVSGKLATLCSFNGPNGTLAIRIKPVNPATQSAAMDQLVASSKFTPIAGLGDKAVVLQTAGAVDLIILKGSLAVEVTVGLSGKSADQLLDIAKQLAGEILGKV